MNKILFIGVLFFQSSISFSQIQDPDYVLENPRDYTKFPARNANYIELLGNGGLYSLNYDRIFIYKEKFKVSGRAGAAVFFNNVHVEQTYLIENNYIFFSNPHHLEIGPGLTFQTKYNTKCNNDSVPFWESLWFGMFRLGYRFQRREEGFFFRAGITPVFFAKNDCGTFLPPPKNWFWGGIALGISF